MPELKYRVSEAVLIRHEAASAWSITFTPLGPGERVVMTLAAPVVEQMSFTRLYTRAEIDALTA